MTTELEILTRIVEVLRSVHSMNTNNCYLSIIDTYEDGQPPQVVQVVQGPVRTDELPLGGQIGGNVKVSRMSVDVVYWLRLNLDRPGRSSDILTASGKGMVEFIAKTKAAFWNTSLAIPSTIPSDLPNAPEGLLLEKMLWEGESGTQWYDMDNGVAKRTSTFSVIWAETSDDPNPSC